MKLQYPAPLCIASPTRRSGTTLLQRLLCSADNALIYGESCANDLNILASLLTTKQIMLGHGTAWRDEQLSGVLAGQVNEWIADLMPPTATYLDMYRHSLFNLSDRLAAYAASQSRSVWGVKMAEWNPAQLLQLQQLLPGTKIIYLHRQLEDCIRSAKRIDLIVEVRDVQQFAHTWQQFGDYARQHLRGPAVLHLNYEELIADPDYWLPQIAAFVGTAPLDATVLKSRINTDRTDPRLAETDAAFLPPASLTSTEEEIIASYSELKSTV